LTAHIPTIAECQQALLNAGFDPGPIDGLGGHLTQAAILKFQAARGIPSTGQLDQATVNALFPVTAPFKFDLSTLIGLIGPILDLTKGKTLTSDQITGVVRAILAAVFGYITGKGWIDTNTAATVSGAVLTLLTAAWSIYSNRPKTIVPIASK
jgi:peptidoglycan hydrolase-like protein with peptidoglycan-binding domain